MVFILLVRTFLFAMLKVLKKQLYLFFFCIILSQIFMSCGGNGKPTTNNDSLTTPPPTQKAVVIATSGLALRPTPQASFDSAGNRVQTTILNTTSRKSHIDSFSSKCRFAYFIS